MANWDCRDSLAQTVVDVIERGHVCEPQEFSICCGYPKMEDWDGFCCRCGEKAVWETVCFKCEEGDVQPRVPEVSEEVD